MDTKSTVVTTALIQGLFQIYPGEAAKLLTDLPVKEIIRILQNEPVSSSVAVFERLDPDIAAELIRDMESEYFFQLFTIINPTRGASLLSRLDKDTAENLLALLPPGIAKEYQELMTYPPESAGNLMDPRVAIFREDNIVEEVLLRIRDRKSVV